MDDGDEVAARAIVTGTGGRLRPGPLALDMRLSGTTSRFLLPVVATFGEGPYRVDGGPPLRARPMGPVLDGVAALGATVEAHGEPGHLPVTITTPGAAGGRRRGRRRRHVEPVPLRVAAGRPWHRATASGSR